MWKRGIWSATVLLLAGLVGGVVLKGIAAEKEPVGALTFYIGDVRVRPPSKSTWDKASLNHTIFNGYSIRAGEESRAELTLEDGSVVRIGEQAILNVDDISIKDGKVEGKASLPFGRMWAKMKKLGDEGVEVKSPTVVMAVRGTTWRADAAADSSVNVYVYDGQVDVIGSSSYTQPQQQGQPQQPQGQPVPVDPGLVPVPGPYEITLEEWIQVTAGMQVSVRQDGSYATSQFDQQTDGQDSWVQWNMERDTAGQ